MWLYNNVVQVHISKCQGALFICNDGVCVLGEVVSLNEKHIGWLL